MGYAKERIKADCAEPKSIDELRSDGYIELEPLERAEIASTMVFNTFRGTRDYPPAVCEFSHGGFQLHMGKRFNSGIR